MKKLFIPAVLWLSALVSPVAAQTIVERYECLGKSVSYLTNDAIAAEESDNGWCTTLETTVFYIASGDTGLASQIEIIDVFDRTPTIKITWIGTGQGVINLEVKYNKWITHFSSCDVSVRYMYTYKIYRQDTHPSGTVLGDTEILVAEPQNGVTFNLNYFPSPSFPSDLTATNITYFNGVTDVEQDITKTGPAYDPTPIQYHATQFGTYPLVVKITTDGCDSQFSLQPQQLKVRPSCFYDNPSIGFNNGITPYDDGSFKVEPNQEYALTAESITDFATHYEWKSDGGDDVIFNGNNFTVLKDLGSYRITAELRTVLDAGEDNCKLPDALQLVLGNNNVTLDQSCPIVFPEDLVDFGYQINPTDFVWQHFTVTAKSKRSITVNPGVTLDLGAELVLEAPDPKPVTDPSLNYIETISYDEYRRVISSSRSYFDEKGAPTQTQYKNLTTASVLASETLYDAFGRAVISTLSAPVTADDEATNTDECGEIVDPNELVDFGFKEGFVKASETEAYNYNHFDLTNEETPLPVDGSEEGTLGWYYSTNNGSSSNPKMNEPLVATTQYPYSRTLFHHDGTGNVKGSTKPGDAFKAGSGHLATTNTLPVLSSDVYLDKYLDMREAEDKLFKPEENQTLPPRIIAGEFFRTVTIDVTGKKAVTYTDKSGNTIISLYFVSETAANPLTKSYQFYDLAGRLKVSISPNGVEQYERTPPNNIEFAKIDKTTYTYNYKGWLIESEETESEILETSNTKGITEFVYRKDGKIRFSQNPKQAKPTLYKMYSYTNYDRSGRPVESGEYIIKEGGIAFKSAEMLAVLESKAADGGLPEANGNKRDKGMTFYDEPDPALLALDAQRVQRFVQGAVSYTKKDDHITTWYSYDERGRVEWMVQQIEGLGLKTIDYRYGPTGQVQEVLYQKGNAAERFSHFYEYDADGRFFKAYTTTEALVYDKFGKLTNPGIDYDDNDEWKLTAIGPLKLQATYLYYLHGPLKRIELGEDLQGIDYVYTADGALKAINNADPDATAVTAEASKDPGKDGYGNGFRKDVFGMTLEYFDSDYTGANDVTDNATFSTEHPEQYTGLIRAMRWHSPIEPNKQFAYAYTYDNRYQFSRSDWGVITNNAFTVNPLQYPETAYRESIDGYDLNGNISGLLRKNSLGDNIANFDYRYVTNTNKLDKILDRDDDNAVLKDYTYNEIGELTDETGETEKHIDYDVTGKVTKVFRDASKTKLAASFVYDDRGFRLNKTSYNDEGVAQMTTWYVRDASGNVMASYEQNIAQPASAVVTEMPVYASGRIGLYKPEFNFTMYELNDHLGNVRAVIGKTTEVEYLATMESERLIKERSGQEGYFDNISNDATATDFNHTPATVTVNGVAEPISDPNEVNRLNNLPVNGEPTDPVGTGIMLWVHPGDIIETTVQVKYTDFNTGNHDIIPLLAGYLTSVFGPTPTGIDGPSIFNVVDQPAFLDWPAWDDLDDDQPRAFLNYLLFDNDDKLQLYDFAQVSSAAKITGAAPGHDHEQLSLQIEVQKEGYIYIYVSNQSDQNTEVYFDDLYVKHTYSDIVAGGDFYPFGLTINDRQIQRDLYRHGYQGKFAEKDEETGWNHFELRDYDPVIGRWFQKDPEGQFYSPYVGMGNDPTNGVDPNGGYLFGLFGSTHQARFRARRDAKLWGGEVMDITSKHLFVRTFSSDPNGFNQGTGSGAINLAALFTDVYYNRDGSYNGIDVTSIQNSYATGEIEPFNVEAEIAFAVYTGGMSIAARGGTTVLGTDAATALNASRMVSERGIHQVLVHGTADGFIVNGVSTSAKDLARIMLQNGFQSGTKVRLISCNTGIAGDGAAYQLSRFLRSPVLAPTNKIRTLNGGGYEIFGGGRFRTFFNTTIK